MGDASTSTADTRAALASRLLPTMTLSTATSPLTAPLPPLSASTTPALRAQSRFACPGNAIITGGAGNLALAATRALLEHGTSQITLLDLPSTLKASSLAIDTLASDFPSAAIHQFPVDVTSESAVSTAFASAHEAMGGVINMLLCFAGTVSCVASVDDTAGSFRKVVDVNLTGAFLCAQAAAKFMIASNTTTATASSDHSSSVQGNSILFCASMSGSITNYPQPQAAYNASKAGLLHLTKHLAAEWAVHGIRVNAISPGYMDTVLNAGSNLQVVRDMWAARCPMGRMGDVEEITGPVVLLMSPRAGRYMTGINLTVDGGTTCF